MLRYSSTLVWPLFFYGAVIFTSFNAFAQGYDTSKNFELRSGQGPSTRQDGDTYDGKLTQQEYERRREKYLRNFRKKHTLSEYKKEKQRLEQQYSESKLNEDLQKARDRERRWKEEQELKRKLKNNPVVVDSLKKAFEHESPTREQSAAPQVSHNEMLQELQSLQGQIKTGDISMEDLLKVLNKAAGPEQENIEVPKRYRGKMAEVLYKSLHQVRSVPAQALDQQFRKQLKGHPLEQAIKSHDKIIPKAVEFIQDPHALPDASMLLSQKRKLLLFALFNFCLFIFGLFLKRRIKKNTTSFARRFVLHFMRWGFCLSLSIGMFVYLFGENLHSFWRVLTN